MRPDEAKYLWRRAEELARLRGLLRVRLGKEGLTHSLVAACAELLERHELIRVRS